MYILKPSVPISLEMVIFIKVLNILVIKPPNRSIIVDLKNLFIIINFMKKLKFYFYIFIYMLLCICVYKI